jgi:hypothetical protein
VEPRGVADGEVLALSLADCEAYWNAQGKQLRAAQERWRAHEREWRANLAAQGLLPAEWLVADIRSGAKERRDQRNMQALLHDRARLARLKRDGYSFDANHRLVAPALARVHTPERRESEARPRGRRARRSGSSRKSPSSEPDEPADLERLRPLTAVGRAYLRAEVDRRRREAVGARPEVHLFDEDGAA